MALALLVENGIHDTSSSIGMHVCYILVCVPEAQGNCDGSNQSNAVTHDTRHSHDALIIDGGADFCRVTLITNPHTHTTHSHAPSRKCTMGKYKIYIMEIPQWLLVCVPEAQGTATYCEFSRLKRSYALMLAREHSPLTWRIDALIAGRSCFAASH